MSDKQNHSSVLNSLTTSSNLVEAFSRFAADVATSEWTPQRRFIASIITSRSFEVVLAILVVFNLGLAIIETDNDADGVPLPSWLKPVEHILLLFYCLEWLLRLYIFRAGVFKISVNVFDFVIVFVDAVFFLLGLAAADLPQIVYLRVVRLVRLSRIFHLLASQAELYIMVEAVFASLKSTLYGCVFIGVILLIYSIIAMQFLRPLSVEFSSTCSRCPHSFDSVYMAFCTFVQTGIVGDEWGDTFLPYMDKYPETSIFIITVFVTVNFGLMNLIMAVIVDSASQARVHNTRRIAEQKERELVSHHKKLHKLCEEMDEDNSQSITLDELVAGYDHHADFKRTLHALEIGKDDLLAVFAILDEDKSGSVEYGEFVSQLHKMKSNNVNTMLVFIKHYVMDLKKDVAQQLAIVKDQIACGILRLEESVEQQLKLMHENLETSTKALQSVDRTALEEEKILKEDDRLLRAVLLREGLNPVPANGSLQATVAPVKDLVSDPTKNSAQDFALVMPAEPLGKTAPMTPGEDIALDGRLQVVTEQVAAALEDLRCKCDSSAGLLKKFDNLLRNDSRVPIPSLRSAAKTCATGHIANDGKSDHVSSWPTNSCCAPQLAARKPGVPTPFNEQQSHKPP